MLLLMTKSLPEVLRVRERVGPYVGRLYTPRHCNAVEATVAAEVPWAADNDAFSDFDAGRFSAMLSQVSGQPGCRFVSAPDEVGDARLTLQRLETWGPVIHDHDLPVAFVLQNGIDQYPVPWSEVDAVFVGGDDEFKHSKLASDVVAEANARGIWAHMGRVNTLRRIRYAASVGCDSIDGSGWSRFTDTWMHLLHALPFGQMAFEGGSG